MKTMSGAAVVTSLHRLRVRLATRPARRIRSSEGVSVRVRGELDAECRRGEQARGVQPGARARLVCHGGVPGRVARFTTRPVQPPAVVAEHFPNALAVVQHLDV